MKKLNKKGKFAAAVVVGASLFFGGYNMNHKEEKTVPAATVQTKASFSYPDEYNFVKYRVELVNDKGEVFAEAFDGAEGLYLDNNRQHFEKGDVIQGIFDSSNWELVAVEMVEEATILAEDGSKVPASYYE